jgi:hypothetical protein
MLVSRYLGITLPFPLLFASIPIVKLNANEDKVIALFDSNLESFVVALALFDYDIAYLCHSQNVQIPLEETHQTLEMIARCCSSAELGQYNRELMEPFPLEIEDVIEHHRTMVHTKPWEMLNYDSVYSNDQWDMVDAL